MSLPHAVPCSLALAFHLLSAAGELADRLLVSGVNDSLEVQLVLANLQIDSRDGADLLSEDLRLKLAFTIP